MKTIKIIDLINRCLEKDCTLPRKIKYRYKEYYREEYPCYYTYQVRGCSVDNIVGTFTYMSSLIDEVEIIEEPTQIEHIEYLDGGLKGMETLFIKVNEIITAVNELKKGSDNNE